jgi:hypothetical protein
MSITVAELFKAMVYGRLLAGYAGSNPDRDIKVCCVLCVVRSRCLRRADPSSREVLPTVVCLTKCD